MPATKDDSDDALKRKDGWVMKRCVICRGTGTVDKGGISGVVPGACEHCNSGIYWEHEVTGVRAMYPGGPFV